MFSPRSIRVLKSAHFSSEPLWARSHAGGLSQRAGLRYQAQAQGLLRRTYEGASVVCSPWVKFIDECGHGYCQPDAYVYDTQDLTIFEIKLSHVDTAYAQLSLLYKPVLEHILHPRTITLCEITRTYNPYTRNRVQPNIIFDLAHMAPERFNIFVWRPSAHEMLIQEALRA